ncbi:CHAT domain-containing protein [Psychroserpens sp. MEBiC05023]
MIRYSLLILCVLFSLEMKAQSSTLFFDTYEDSRKARSLCYDEKYDEAMVYVNKVKSKVEASKQPNSLDTFETFCSISIIEADIYKRTKQFDKGIQLVKGIREHILNSYDMFNIDVFSYYSMLVLSENGIYIEAERYDKSLTLLKFFKYSIINEYNLKNPKIFSQYELVVLQEGMTYLSKADYKGYSEMLHIEANRIKPMMKGNVDKLDFYFTNMASSIDNSVMSFEIDPENKPRYLKAAQDYKRLIDELLLYNFENTLIKQKYLESFTKQYYKHKADYFNPRRYSVIPERDALIEAKSNLEALSILIQSDSILKRSDKINLKERFEKNIASIKQNIFDIELNEGRYQKLLTESKEKVSQVTNSKDYLYFMNKLGELSILLTSEMYNQYKAALKALIIEAEQSNLKAKDWASYCELNYYIYLNLYSVHSQLNDFEKALVSIDKAMEFYNKQPSEKILSEVLNSSKVYYATLYFQQRNFKKALEYYEDTDILDDIDENMMSSYSFIGQIYYEMGAFDKALLWQKKYLDYLEPNEEDYGYDYANSYAHHQLGKTYLALNIFDKAENEFLIALEGYQSDTEFVNQSNYILITLYADMGILYANWNKMVKSEKNMRSFAKKFRTPFFESLLNVNEYKRANVNSQNVHGPNTLFYYLSQNKSNADDLIGFGYDYALLSKELLLNTSETIRNNASINDIPELKAINTKLTDVNNQLKEIDVVNRDSLIDHSRAFEKEIIIRGKKQIVQLFENSKIEWTDVQKNLKLGEAAIEFVSFKPYRYLQNQDDVMYGAFILLKEAQFPLFISLCSERELTDIVNPIVSKTGTTKSAITELYEANNTTMYNLIWRPLETYINKAQTIYFSPSGILHNFSFSALVTPFSNTELRTPQKLIQLGSTKDIVNFNSVAKFDKAALFGDIEYNSTQKPSEIRGDDAAIRYNRGSDFKKLPGTKKEIEQIERILEQNAIHYTTFIQKKASEENLIIASNEKPDIIHIGTHAFYLEPIADEFFATDLIGSGFLNQQSNPMNRSGLALAEANYFWKYGNKITKNREDGILTANEISTLDLRNVKLAVMSACETGLGESQSNEGVFGLQRGLKMAGAQKLLVSLWKVDDNVTQEYMVEFYNNLIEQKKSIQDAYFRTQNKIKAKYPNPYYWAAFVLIN